MKLSYVIILGILLFILACSAPITSFTECVASGNPVLESYPRQCTANGQTFVEEIPEQEMEQEPEQEEIPSESFPEKFHTCTESEKQAQACTLDYRPVCGLVDNGIRCVTTPCQSTDAITFGNGCAACAAQALGYYSGACQEQLFVVCKETFTGFDPVDYAKNNNGICVDICPHNYDAFLTQIGVTECIPHYGTEEITSWSICDKSSQNCNCVKAYETTTEEPLENPAYRCVPEHYAQRLLFRGGMDKLDEQGQSAVAIA